MSATEYFITNDGRQPIPGEVVAAGRQTVEAFIQRKGWRAPTKEELAASEQAIAEQRTRALAEEEERLPKPEPAAKAVVDPDIEAAIKAAATISAPEGEE